MDSPRCGEFETGVSIVIPAYNYKCYIVDAVESALAQDYTGPLEILIVDDGSTDGTAAEVLRFGSSVRYCFKENGGLSAARNTGMALAKYDWVLFLDADDVLEADAVSRLVGVRARMQFPAVVIGCLGRKIDAVGNCIFGEVRRDETIEIIGVRDLVLKNRIAPIVLADRRLLLGLGGFDPAFKSSEDRDMWIRAATLGDGSVVRLNFTLYRKRVHGGNMSLNAGRQTASILQLLDRYENGGGLGLDRTTFRTARAICFYQSARMYFSSGNRAKALFQCLRSIFTKAVLGSAEEIGMPRCFRLRFLAVLFLGRGAPKTLPERSLI